MTDAVATVTRVIADSDDMHDLGVALAKHLQAGDLVLLTGPLGAGKTTLSRGIGEGLGVRGPVTSPTFVLARTHPSLIDGPPLVHVDAYRLGHADELDDLDLDYEHSVVLVEWGAGLVDTRDHWLEITITRPTGGDIGDAGGIADGAALSEETDVDEGDEPIEPRTVSITAYGKRWSGGILR